MKKNILLFLIENTEKGHIGEGVEHFTSGGGRGQFPPFLTDQIRCESYKNVIKLHHDHLKNSLSISITARKSLDIPIFGKLLVTWFP